MASGGKEKWRSERVTSACYCGVQKRAGSFYDDAMKTAIKVLSEIELVVDFVESNREKLAGLYWGVGFDARFIAISTKHFKGKKCDKNTAFKIAQLWPELEWKRKKDAFEKHKMNWVAEIDGVEITIVEAEVLAPDPEKLDGSLVALSRVEVGHE